MTRFFKFPLTILLLSGLYYFGSAYGEEEKTDEGEPEKGPHHGIMLRDGDFALEVTIFEKGVPPQYRIFVYENDKPIEPSSVNVKIELKRLLGRVDVFELKAAGEYLTSDKVVEEPHSFDVKVDAEGSGKKHTWTYPSYEGRTEMTTEAIAQSGIGIEAAGPARLRIKLSVEGRIVPDEDHLAHVSPRYPGIVKEVRKRLGDRVKQGDTLAVVESNVGLTRYEVHSVLSGTVVKKDVTIGEFVSENDTIYVVANLATVWVDLNIYRQDFPKIKVGQELSLRALGGADDVKTTISYISPFGSENTQSMLARAVLPNSTGDMLPGLFLHGELLLEEVFVPVAVRAEAVQKFRDWDVVFLQDGNTFEILPIELGRTDGEWIEVLSPLRSGQKYVTANSFVIKADILKSGASHDH